MRAPEPALHVSRNRLEGSLADTPLAELLAACRRHLVTGTIKLATSQGKGLLLLRAGAVDQARFGDVIGDAAVERMSRLDDGMYELVQRLPDLAGALGSAAQLEGEIGDVALPTLMRHCEDNALSCTLIVVSGFDRGEITYRAGEIVDVAMNGRHDLDAIVAITRWQDARFRVQAPPLPDEIAGWPKVSREPTAPMRLRHLAAPAPGDVAPPAATPPAPGDVAPPAATPPAPVAAARAGRRAEDVLLGVLLVLGLSLLAFALLQRF